MSARCLCGGHKKNWITGQTVTWPATNSISFSELLIKFQESTPRDLHVMDWKGMEEKRCKECATQPSLGFLDASAPQFQPSDNKIKFICI